MTPMMAPKTPPKSNTSSSPMPSADGEDQVAEQGPRETEHE